MDSDYGKDNKIFTREKAEAALERLRAKYAVETAPPPKAAAKPIRAMRWMGQPATIVRGNFLEVCDQIPHFVRVPFSLPTRYLAMTHSAADGPFGGTEEEVERLIRNIDSSALLGPSESETIAETRPGRCDGTNPRFDVIISVSGAEREKDVPVGIVSRRYVLVQHREIIEAAQQLFRELRLDPHLVRADLILTEFGEKMALKVQFPPAFDFDPGDGHPMALRMEWFNAVDGTMRIGVRLCWFRLICSNGLAIRRSRLDLNLAHDLSLERELPRLFGTLKSSVSQIAEERQVLISWLKASVSQEKVAAWADSILAKAWGQIAAARVFLIATTGRDGESLDRFVRVRPSERHMDPKVRVPGSPQISRTAFDVSQALSWVAGTSLDVEHQLDRVEQIPDLVEALVAE